MEHSCVVLKTHHLLRCVFLSSLFSLSPVPHLHLPHPGPSHTQIHTVRRNASPLQSRQYAPSLPVMCAILSICKHICSQVHHKRSVSTNVGVGISISQHPSSIACAMCRLVCVCVCVRFLMHVGRWNTVQSRHHCGDPPGSSMSF